MIAAAILLAVVAGPVSPAALDHVRDMNAAEAGVDRNGNFWYWDAADLSVSTITPDGQRETVDLDPHVRALDVDRERGVVTLARDGKTVRVISLSGTLTSEFELPFIATKLCWMDGAQIAVAPSMSSWTVEVWSTKDKAVVRRMGSVPVIEAPAAGAVLTRVTLLRYDAQRRQLVTLDAFGGNLAVFDRSGKVVRRGRIESPELASASIWLRELDERSKQKRESQTPSVWNYVRFSLSPDGTVWLGEKSAAPGTVTIAKILPDGTVRRETASLPACPSVRFELWGDQLLFFRNTKSATRCVAMKERKR